MKGIVITTNNTMRVQDFSEPAYKSISDAVGGYIEIVHPKRLEYPYCMLVNEEGIVYCLPFNSFCSYLYGTDTHGWPIAGNAVLLKEGVNNDGEPDILGLDEQDIKYLCDMVAKKSAGDVKWEQKKGADNNGNKEDM